MKRTPDISATRNLPVTTERRRFLKTAAGVAAATTAITSFPAIGQNRTLNVGSYGGYFEDSFKKHVYPAFTEATGIAVESVTQPNSTDWLVTMQQAAAAKTVPADLSLYARDTMIKASRIGELLAPIDVAKITSTENLDPYFLFEANDGV